ncbi:MAG: AAA family ATPase [Spirochaetota bacterium]
MSGFQFQTIPAFAGNQVKRVREMTKGYMLDCYYDIRRKEKFEELFGHLDIGRNPTGERNSYMVLRLNFSTVQVSQDMARLAAKAGPSGGFSSPVYFPLPWTT